MATQPPIASTETIVWTGHPSQVKNLKVFIICFLLCWLIVPIFYAIWKFLEVRCHTYELTTQRLRTRRGVFNKQTEELELYRIKDITLVEQFWMRMFSLGNLLLITSDRTTPELLIEAIHEPAKVRDQLRALVENMRDTKRVREVDFDVLEPPH
jgi:uncharacterized membrane protein YdbT with pleckstrin-like domain